MSEVEIVILNKLEVARNAAKAYKERRLSAQGTTPSCRYRDRSGCPCVIGASVPPGVARIWDTYGDPSITNIYEEEQFITDDIEALNDLQETHDKWANNAYNVGARTFEKLFVEAVNDLLPEEERIIINTGDGGTEV